jgi:Zn-dependent alcohol dehydrogenase
VDIPRWVRLWERGHRLADGVITHEFPFAAINAALDVVRQGEGGRVLLTFGK